MKKYLLITLLWLTGCQDPTVTTEPTVQYQTIQTEDITIRVPVDIHAETLFNIAIDFPNTVTIIASTLEPIAMDMGIIPVFFRKEGIDSQFKADLLVGSCSLAIMPWRLTIEWEENGQRKSFDQVISIKR